MTELSPNKRSGVKRFSSLIHSRFSQPLWYFNQVASSRQARLWLVIGVFLFALVCYLVPVVLRGDLGIPPRYGDGYYYDCEAWQISQGNGFIRDFTDPTYLEPYEQATKERGLVYRLPNYHSRTVETKKPPLFPYLLAGSYKIFGRQFVAIRIFNAMSMAGTCAIVFWLLLRRIGLVPALLFVAMFAVITLEIREFATAILTESLACLFVACIALSLIRLGDTGRARWICLAGVVTGLSVLTRSIFILWLPGLALLVYLVLASATVITDRPHKWRLLSYYVLITSALILPWFIRNCIVLNAFMPTGTHGFIGLAAVYCDKGIEHEGEWKNLEKGFFRKANFPKGLTRMERQKHRYRYCRSLVMSWVRNNPKKVLKLTLTKISRFWLKGRSHFLAVLLSLLGLFIYRGYPEAKVFLGLFLCCTLQIALTYLNQGRFQIPILSLLHASAAVGFWSVAQLATNRGKAFRHSLFLENSNSVP